MRLAKIFLILAILAGGYFFYLNYQSQNNFLEAEAIFSTTVDTINPFQELNFHNSRLNLVYESLIQTDSTLQFQPNLATSFGQIDEKTWQFSVKQNVKFHDGQDLTADLVVSNFQALKSNPNFKTILQNINSTQLNPDNNQQIIFNLNQPDPTFLQKISIIPISSTLDEGLLAESSYGTGPYTISSYSPSLFKLELNQNYHSTKPFFQKLTLSTINDNYERIQRGNTQQGTILIENLSPSYIDQLNTRKFQLQSATNLSTNFFLINQNSAKLNTVAKRQAIQNIFPSETLSEYTENLGIPTNQLLPKGVLGYNSQISPLAETTQQSKSILAESGLKGSSLNIMLPVGSEKLELYLQETLFEHGMTAQIDFVDYTQVNLKQTSSRYDLIFLGWKNEFADGQEFFESVVQANAEYNLGRYNNQTANQLIKSAQTESDQVKRQELLQQVSLIVTEQDPIAIPLFENQIYYATNKKFVFQDRLDGHINLKDFTLK